MHKADQVTVHCHVDSTVNGEIRGWAMDMADPSRPVTLHIIVDGQEVGTVLCDTPRADLATLPRQDAGFAIIMPDAFRQGETHRVVFRDSRRRAVQLAVEGGEIEEIEFRFTVPLRWFSHVDGVRNGGLEGWVLRNQPTRDELVGNAMVRITCDGLTIGHARATLHRGDVGKAFATTTNCGFRFVPPRAYLKPYKQTFRFFLMPENLELRESPLETSFIDDKQEEQLLQITEAVDRLHAQITSLRRQIASMSAVPRYTVGEYDSWFRTYETALRARVAESRNASADLPLVSIVCPVYRPALDDFRAAVQSVLDQSYANWELVLVDDGSKDPELTAVIEGFAAQDKRVVVARQRRNLGISGATNTALKAAKGEWIAFFDHDDLLVDVAVEVMVRAAQRSGAQMVYSDEDKVDAGGTYLEPAFKPDWNHRLLLGVNYVCHLLMVHRDALAKAGPLDARYNGAQDHDLILRLSEVVPRTAIHHVHDILYHWRITPQSTASSVSNKDYAVQAGVDAVSAHLARLGRPATVSCINGITLYRADWQVSDTPPVTVIVPFKDEIETTRRCVQHLMDGTDYGNFDVVLVDNWSTSTEAEAFRDEMAGNPRVRIMRLEEPFNYSRLNNAAVATTKAEFYVFMNNDLFVKDRGWLRASINEMLIDPEVGIVGGQFFYPNGVVQHAGVVLGIGGVAGHVHVGVPRGEYGYAGRMYFAQEMSAVTAAGMVVRAAAFHKVGGFDEVGLKVAFNDIDLCLKVTTAGYRVIWTPDFVADHHESLSRGNDERPVQEARFFHETQTMIERWGDKLRNDPYYNRHFDLDRQSYFDLTNPALG